MSRRRVITDEDRATALRMKAQMAPEGYGYNEILGAVADRLGSLTGPRGTSPARRSGLSSSSAVNPVVGLAGRLGLGSFCPPSF